MSDGIKTGRKKEAERDRRGNGGAAGAEHYRGKPEEEKYTSCTSKKRGIFKV